MKILHNFHEFSRSKNQPGIRKKNTREFLLGADQKRKKLQIQIKLNQNSHYNYMSFQKLKLQRIKISYF